MKLRVITLLSLGALSIPALADSSARTLGSLESHDPRFDKIVDPAAKIEVIGEDFSWIEGPLWLPEHECLLFSNIPANRIWKWTPEKGAVPYLEKSGYTGKLPRPGAGGRRDEPGSNGLILAPDGSLVLCQHGLRQVARMKAPLDAPKAVYEPLTQRNHEGKRYNSPNDGCFHSDGSLYFTDPPYGLPGGMNDPSRETPYCGVYRVSKDGKVSLIDDSMERPNGIGLSPDQRTLYVANSHGPRALWMAYELDEQGLPINKKVFHDATKLVGTRKGMPDGLEVAETGHVFATGPGGVWVLSPEGDHLGTIATREFASNVAFSPDQKTLYITADMLLLRVRLR